MPETLWPCGLVASNPVAKASSLPHSKASHPVVLTSVNPCARKVRTVFHSSEHPTINQTRAAIEYLIPPCMVWTLPGCKHNQRVPYRGEIVA